jgi:toxin HigB-1
MVCLVIRSFADRETEKAYHRDVSRRIPIDVQASALPSLRMLGNARERRDLRRPPGNRLERLTGERAGPYSVRINEIVLGKRRVSTDTALRLGRSFDTTPQFWLGLQTDFDLDVVSDELGDRLDREVRAPTARA